jgi:DNA-binding MarR family transcriptional regulator
VILVPILSQILRLLSILVTFETNFKPGHTRSTMLELEKFLPYRLSVLSNQVSRGIAETYAGRFGLGVTEWRVIAILGRYPELTATEVAERAAMDKVAVSRAVRRLLDSGLLERREGDADRRIKHLCLSQGGVEVFDAIAPAALEYERQLLARLDPDERQVFDRVVDKLLSVSRKATPSSSPNPLSISKQGKRD